MFLDKLEVEYILDFDFMDEEDVNKNGHRICKWLQISNDLYLSVQASAMHYCIPREYVDLNQYTHFELGVIIEDSLAYNYSILKDFPRYKELESYYDYGIFAYVPKDLINDLYCWAIEHFKED